MTPISTAPRQKRSRLAKGLLCSLLALPVAVVATRPPQPVPAGISWRRHVIAENFHAFTAVPGDFTGDGVIDVIANGGPDDKDVLFVGPDWKPVVLHAGIKSTHSTVLDVNGDGRLDLVGSRYLPGLIYWLEQPELPMSGEWKYHVIDGADRGGVDGVHGLKVADVNGDGRPDLISNSAGPGGGFPNSIVWFEMPRLIRHVLADHDAPGMSHYIAVADVNGDKRLDVATAAKTGNWFAWWEAPANVEKPWKKHLISEGEEGATNILIADINGDGRADFVASRGHGRGLVWFEAPDWKRHDFGNDLAGPHSLAIGDVDGDGYPDVVTCAKDSKILVWFKNDGKGGFTPNIIHKDQAGYEVHLVDMDADGDLDILVAGQDSLNITWYENQRRGSR